MKFALFLPTEPNEMWRLGAQLGVTEAVTGIPRVRPEGPSSWGFLPLLHMKQRFADMGLNVAVIESTPPMNNIKLGLPGRDKEIEQVCELLTNMGAVGIPVWCYNFMAVFGWLRTSMSTVSRGGALVTSYNHELMEQAPLTEAGVVSEEQLWENFAYFLERVVPVAEQAGVKMALHPDDPPISPIRGVGRIFTSVEAFKRMLALAPSEYNGLTFCQGSFATMGEHIPTAIRALQDRIHFVHFRDIRGTARSFVETFHDAGPTDMAEAMRCYQEIGFSGVMRPDHVPTLEGDANDTPGYTTRGRLYAIGYMRGLAEASEKAPLLSAD
ncbi:MAG: mannonate dehydratase [Ktedonobacteraceae bacterium]|nr:mannonate dehydratase [Ktedonobacteraceae bacterium]